MSLINVLNLTFGYEGSYDNVFENVSFQIDTDWRLGFCGRNGRGKTTFLRLLMGEFEYNGSISSKVKFDYFPPKVENASDLVLDVLEKLVVGAELWQFQRELGKLKVDEGVLYRPLNTLSYGEQTKVLLAALFLNENNFLLIDEPTNHLDLESRRLVAQYLNGKKGFILVSHDRAFLDECTDHTLSINRNNIEVISGNFSTWAEQKRLTDSFELAQNEKLEREIKRLKASAGRASEWAGKGYVDATDSSNPDSRQMGYKEFHRKKAGKLDSQAKNLQGRQDKAIEEKSRLLKNLERTDELKLSPLDYYADRILSLNNIKLTFDDRVVLDNFNLTLERGQRLALVGGNGSGKSSILKLICGENIPFCGEIKLGSKLIISYIPQSATLLCGSLTDFAKQNELDETLFKCILSKLDFSKTQFDKDMADFSAGQKKKVLLAKSLAKSAHVYIWDEPLNYIDILSRIQIEELILAFKPTMIFVEHDKVFCDRVATEKIELI